MDCKVERIAPGQFELARETFACLARVFEEPYEEAGDAYLETLLHDPRFWAMAALEDQRVIGGLTAWTLPLTAKQERELLIYDLAVAPTCRRRGVARRLVEGLLQQTGEQGISVAWVPADNEDSAALAFYRSLGASPSPTTIFSFGEPDRVAERGDLSNFLASSVPIRAGSPPRYFARGGGRYHAYRPSYGASLAADLAGLVEQAGMAVDVGCGNGQLAAVLAQYFEQVVAIDSSESQLARARAPDNVVFRQGTAERLDLPTASADLVVAAQAAHWFDLDAFYAESRRVAKDGAVIALVSYGVPYLSDAANAVLQHAYWLDLHHFWPSQRKHVENGYALLPFPFEERVIGEHSCRLQMHVEHFIAYVRTWSAYKLACDQHQEHLFSTFFDKLREVWPKDEEKTVIWPLSARVGRIR